MQIQVNGVVRSLPAMASAIDLRDSIIPDRHRYAFCLVGLADGVVVPVDELEAQWARVQSLHIVSRGLFSPCAHHIINCDGKDFDFQVQDGCLFSRIPVPQLATSGLPMHRVPAYTNYLAEVDIYPRSGRKIRTLVEQSENFARSKITLRDHATTEGAHMSTAVLVDPAWLVHLT